MKKINRISARVLAAAAALVLGVSPVSPALALAVSELVPMGNTVGIELKAPGAIVVGLENPGGESAASPAKEAGVLPGDLVIKLGADDISSSADFMDAASRMDGSRISMTVLRDGKKLQFTLAPEKIGDGYRLGLWLRDSVTGIGTMTFYDPASGLYGALGHPINDADTGVIMPLGSGSIMEATVVDVQPGQCGKPGELRGVFDMKNPVGSILINSCAGIFGKASKIDDDRLREPLPLARDSDIHLGKAAILSGVSGRQTEEYEVEITRIYRGDDSGRGLMLKITDPRLLQMTGGIVQGMSGSPIIQDGKFVGAVTHVLVNDPTRGYGILINTMLSEGQNALSAQAAA